MERMLVNKVMGMVIWTLLVSFGSLAILNMKSHSKRSDKIRVKFPFNILFHS